jgi:methylenetetrahydrofolate dehydrogenase (NADP+)/methenyltetrahydrofolate cyclohydrolase
MQFLTSKEIINEQKVELKKEIESFECAPHMAVVLVGDNPASLIYVQNKKKFCEKLGAKCSILKQDEQISESDFLKLIKDLNEDQSYDGIIIQLPLPNHLKGISTFGLINPNKDIDGFHSQNVVKLYEGVVDFDKFLLPCTPKGVINLLDFYKIDLVGKSVVILGRSFLVGRPLGLMLLNRNASPTFCHSQTNNIKKLCQNADIVISATGRPEFLDASYFKSKEQQVLIDVGISRNSKNKIVGDININSLSNNKLKVTPVPGGIGPLTVLNLVKNLLIASHLNAKN